MGKKDKSSKPLNKSVESLKESNPDDTISTPILDGDNEKVFDPFKHLNEKQLEVFKEMREAFKDLTDPEEIAFVSDMCILRYLRARNFSFSKSEKLLRNSLEWRRSYRPQDVKLKDVKEIAQTGCLYVHGKDKKSRPIVLARPRRDVLKHVPGSEKFKHLVYWLEEGFRQMDESKGVETFCFIVDYNDFSRKNLDMNTNLESMHLLLDHCPERMGISLFLDPPLLFWVAWKIISPFLNEVTLAKVKFCYSKKVNGKRVYPDLLEYISPDQLEPDLGGECAIDFEQFFERCLKDEEQQDQNQATSQLVETVITNEIQSVNINLPNDHIIQSTTSTTTSTTTTTSSTETTITSSSTTTTNSTEVNPIQV